MTTTEPSAAAAASAIPDECRGDLTLLVHRAALGLYSALDRACQAHGLKDSRDWLVLTALSDEERRTHLELARHVGIDKTTLTAVLDRLERQKLIQRSPDPTDRRARIPVTTAAGRRAWKAVAATRDEIEESVLGGIDADQALALRALLYRIAGAGDR